MTVNAITDTKKGRTGTAPTYLHTTPKIFGKLINETIGHRQVFLFSTVYRENFRLQDNSKRNRVVCR